MSERGIQKEMVGTVIRAKMQKTVIVEARTHVTHKMYGKTIVRRNRFRAHDEKGTTGAGDQVKIRSTRPLSKTKRWKVVEVLRKAPIALDTKKRYTKKKKKEEVKAEEVT